MDFSHYGPKVDDVGVVHGGIIQSTLNFVFFIVRTIDDLKREEVVAKKVAITDDILLFTKFREAREANFASTLIVGFFAA